MPCNMVQIVSDKQTLAKKRAEMRRHQKERRDRLKAAGIVLLQIEMPSHLRDGVQRVAEARGVAMGDVCVEAVEKHLGVLPSHPPDAEKYRRHE